MNTEYRTFDAADEKWPDQWQRVIADWGAPKPAHSKMCGNDAAGFLKWMNILTEKGEQEAQKAMGDGYWECRVHWREVRVSHLQQAKADLEAEPYEQKGHKLVRKPTAGSAVRTLYPTLKSSLPLNKSIVRASPPTPPAEVVPTPPSPYERWEKEELEHKDMTPPPSPSDTTFSLKLDE